MPDIKVLNVGGVKDGYPPGDPADGEYALDVQVPHPTPQTTPPHTPRQAPQAVLCSAAVQSTLHAIHFAVCSRHPRLCWAAWQSATMC